MSDAVVFDLDGVIVDSEHVWDEVREAYTRERGGRYTDRATREMMGMSSLEWSAYMASELAALFAATVSSEEVARGKPAPDVYLEAARRLGVDASRCAAVEDSHNGILSAKAAGMRVIAIPNLHFPPGEDALAEADVVLLSVSELTPTVVEG